MSTPRRKRMKRAARLQSARHKFPNPRGDRRAIRIYARWYGVDTVCAIAELRLLGAKIDEAYVAQLLQSKKPRPKKPKPPEEPPFESDEWHAVIVGYTDSGFSYGLTWDEFDPSASD